MLIHPLSEQVITTGGYREPINLQQIRTNMEMESHEEKLHNMIKISKMESARESAKDAAKVIRERQREQGRMTGIGGGEPSMHASMHTPTPSFKGKHRDVCGYFTLFLATSLKGICDAWLCFGVPVITAKSLQYQSQQHANQPPTASARVENQPQ